MAAFTMSQRVLVETFVQFAFCIHLAYNTLQCSNVPGSLDVLFHELFVEFRPQRVIDKVRLFRFSSGTIFEHHVVIPSVIENRKLAPVLFLRAAFGSHVRDVVVEDPSPHPDTPPPTPADQV